MTKDLLCKAAEIGLLSADIPEKYGGLELNKVSSTSIAEKLTLKFAITKKRP